MEQRLQFTISTVRNAQELSHQEAPALLSGKPKGSIITMLYRIYLTMNLYARLLPLLA